MVELSRDETGRKLTQLASNLAIRTKGESIPADFVKEHYEELSISMFYRNNVKPNRLIISDDRLLIPKIANLSKRS